MRCVHRVEVSPDRLLNALIDTGLAALDCGIRADKHPAKAWPDDRDVPLLLRISVAANVMAVSELQAAPSS